MKTKPREWTSLFSSVVVDRWGNTIHDTSLIPNPNLRTDVGDDWQAAVMLGHQNDGISGTATATTATTLTWGGTFPTTGGGPAGAGQMVGLQGKLIACGPNASGTGSTVYGVIITNTTTVATVDMWQDAATPGTAGTTPNATCKFQVLPGAAPVIYLALTETDVTQAAGDTTLSGELATDGFTRAVYDTYSHSNGASSGFIQKTFTSTGTRTIRSEAVFTAANGGPMPFESDEPNPPTLVSGDTLQQKVTINY
jgi:hypothetical protein